ncbi:MAG: hypothetical protein H6732_18330, partial [Alphaproteobacteria bacterium]|nr:hypothetical protein [Alphaproteobacteria bacterium]
VVTLPATEDADGDGRVEMSITFDVDARMTRWFSWGAGVDWSVTVMELVATSHRAELDPFGVPTGKYTLLGDRGFGPLYTSGQAYQLVSKQTTEDWLLQGFAAMPPVTGSIQISGGP